MYRLLLPGIFLKRWILVVIAGMLCFAIGFVLLLNPQLDLQPLVWRIWQWVAPDSDLRWLVTLTGVLVILLGLWLVGFGTRHLIRAFTSVANPHATGKQLMRALVEKYYAPPPLRIVGIGGGTGLATLLRGLKAYPVELTAIVTVSDDGGSSGRLTADLDMPPPGDIRNCLVALADAEPLMERLFQFRFARGGHDLNGHTLGNLIIAGLSEMEGDFHEAVQEVSHVLAVRGRVLPSANRPLVLTAVMADGSTVRGETAITAHQHAITKIAIDPPEVSPLPETLEAIQEADVIILGPGSVFSSLVPNLVIPGMAEALAASPAIKIFVCNVMTQRGESDDFSASRHLEAVLAHLPCDNPFDYAIVNLQRLPDDVKAIYAEKGQLFVEPDLPRFRALGTRPITGNLLADTYLADTHLARHDHEKLARCIMETIVMETRLPGMLRRRS